MKIPKIVSKENHEYIFEKEYPNFILYKDMLIGTNRCFSRQELGLLKKQPRVQNISPEKVKR